MPYNDTLNMKGDIKMSEGGEHGKEGDSGGERTGYRVCAGIDRQTGRRQTAARYSGVCGISGAGAGAGGSRNDIQPEGRARGIRGHRGYALR